MAYELGGRKKKTPWELFLESYGIGADLGGGPSVLGGGPAAAPVAPAAAKTRSSYAAKRRETLLGGLGAEGYRRTILGAPSKTDVSWRAY